MIRSCEDVKTIKDFHECCRLRDTLIMMGLEETSRMIRWDELRTVSPGLLPNLRGLDNDQIL